MISRFEFGTTIINHRGKNIPLLVGNPTWDNYYQNFENRFVFDIGTIPEMFAHRPDNISNVFYSTPSNWWILMLANQVLDPFEGFNPNDRILIPKL